MQLDQLDQLHERRDADSGGGFFLQSGTRLAVEHPAGNGDLKSVARAHDHARLDTVPDRTHHLHFTPKERVMPVAHPRDTHVMGSVMRPCVTRSPRT